ncbi:MAG: DUF6263 family protein [Ginsengibacter sp.]
MKKISLFTAIAAIFTISCSHKISGTANTVNVAKETGVASGLNLVKGQKYLVENKITTQNTQQVQGQTIESKADFLSSYHIEVKDVKDNNYNLTNTIKTVKVNASAMGQDISFDSQKKEDLDGENGSELKKYIDQPKDIIIDRSGKVISSKKPDTSANSAAQANMITMIMKQMVGDPEEGGYGANMAFEPLPEKAAIGTTWADSSRDDGVSKVTNYTLKEINGNNATIVLDGTMTTDVKSEMQGMQISTKTKGKFTGEDIVDMKTGVIQQRNSTMDASGTISVMGQDIPSSTRVTSVVTVKGI